MSDSITITMFSKKAFIVRGDTKDYIDDFKDMNGRWNTNITGEPGWIFNKKELSRVQSFIDSKKLTKPSRKRKFHKNSYNAHKIRKTLDEFRIEFDEFKNDLDKRLKSMTTFDFFKKQLNVYKYDIIFCCYYGTIIMISVFILIDSFINQQIQDVDTDVSNFTLCLYN